MQRHSQKTRDWYFKVRNSSETSLEAANEVGVPYSTVLKWDGILSETGSTGPREREPTNMELHKDAIEAYLVDHERITLRNLARDMNRLGLDFDSSTYSRYLKKWGWEKVNSVWCKPDPAAVSKQGYGHRKTKHSAYAGYMAEMAAEGCSAQEIADLVNEKFKPRNPVSNKVVDYHVRKQGIPFARRKRSKEPPTPGKSEIAEQSMPAKQAGPAPDSSSCRNAGRSEVEKLRDPDWKVFRHTGRMRRWRKSNPDIASEDIAAMLWEHHGVSTTAEVVDRVLEVRVLSRFAGTITRWYKNEPDIMTIDEVLTRLKDFHSKDAARSTVSFLLSQYGIELQRGRKPKEKKETRLLVVNGKREELPPKQEPKGTGKALIHAVRNFKMPTVGHLRTAASMFVAALKNDAETAGFTDPRNGPNVQYCVFTCLALLMVAINGGNKDLHSMVLYIQSNAGILKPMFNLKKMPSKLVFDSLLKKMTPNTLGILIMLVTARVHIEPGGRLVVAIDGKALRSLMAYDTPKNKSIVTGFEVTSKQIIGAMPSGKGGRELQTARELCQEIRRRWPTEDIFATLDALHGDRKTLIGLFEMGMHICVTVKRNKGRFHREIHDLADRSNHKGHYATSEENRTRDESRMYQAYYPDEKFLKFWNHYFKDEASVPECGMVVVVTSNRNGQEETRIVYLSKVVSIEVAAGMIRQHWYVETKVHYTLDVSYGEDGIKAHTDNSPMNLGILNRGAMNVIQRNMPDARNSDKRHLASSNPLRNLAIMLNDYLPEVV